MSDSSRFRNFIIRWRGYAAAFGLVVLTAIGWLSDEYPNKKLMLRDALAWFRSVPEPTKEATPPPQSSAPAPETKQVEPKQPEPKKIVTGSLPPLPCIVDVVGILSVVGAGGSHARNFDVFFGQRNACLTLSLTAAGDKRMKFETASFWKPNNPTIYVQPALRADLTKYAKGDKLKIEGRWLRYARTSEGPDEIYIVDARITKVE